MKRSLSLALSGAGILVAALSLAGCGRVSNDAVTISMTDHFEVPADRSVVIVGVGAASEIPAPLGVYIGVVGDQRCWLITNIILSEMNLRYDDKKNGIKYFAYNVKPGVYYTNGFVREPFGSQPLTGEKRSIAFTLLPGKIAYIGDFIYHGEIDVGIRSFSGQKQLERDIELRRDIGTAQSVLVHDFHLSGELELAPVERSNGWAKRCGPP